MDAGVWRFRYTLFVRINKCNWIDHVNRMDSKRKLSHLTNLLKEVYQNDDQKQKGEHT